MFNALYKPNQVITGKGQVAIVTGWTVKNAIAKKLDESDYAVIGQLYSPTRGIDFLVRNLLANPYIGDIVILAGTKEDRNAGGSQCLYDFFTFGFDKAVSNTGKDCWKVRSPITGFIDIEVSENALEKLREYVKPHLCLSASESVEVAKTLSKTPCLWTSPMQFPKQEYESSILPSPLYGHRIEGKTIAETWVKILHRIRTTGTIRPTGYDGKWQELIDLVAIVTNEPKDFYFPEPNYLPVDREFIAEYLPQVLDDAPYREGVKYTYGQRLRSWFERDQIEQCITKLIGEVDAASAVMSLWDVKDHEKGGSPCLNHIWFRVVDNALSMTATFRSNDMFGAWASNAMGLRALQCHVRDEIAKRSQYNFTLAPLITISQSAHIYDDCWGNVDSLISNQYQQLTKCDYADLCGDFLIEVCGSEIVASQTMPKGEVVKRFVGTNPLKLIDEIAASSPAIQPRHIGYLGIELHRAAIAIKNNIEFTQDGKL